LMFYLKILPKSQKDKKLLTRNEWWYNEFFKEYRHTCWIPPFGDNAVFFNLISLKTHILPLKPIWIHLKIS